MAGSYSCIRNWWPANLVKKFVDTLKRIFGQEP